MRPSKKMVTNSQLAMWWFPFVVVMVVAVGSLFVLLPQVNQIIENTTALKGIDSQLTKAQAKMTQVDAIDATEIDNLESLAAKALPEHKPYFEVMVTLQQLASETEVTLQDFKIDPGSLATESSKITDAKRNDVVKLSTNLSVKGTTASVSQFVEKLQQSFPLITTTSVSISQSKNTEEVDQRQAQLNLDLYFSEPLQLSEKISYEPLPQFNESQQEIFTVLADYSTKIDAAGAMSSFTSVDRTDIFTY